MNWILEEMGKVLIGGSIAWVFRTTYKSAKELNQAFRKIRELELSIKELKDESDVNKDNLTRSTI